MKSTFLKLGSCAGILLFSMTSHVSAAEYYKWVDAKGTTHYTKTPPPKSSKKVKTVATYGWTNSATTPSGTGQNAVQPENGHPAHGRPNPAGTENDQQQREANEALERGQSERPSV